MPVGELRALYEALGERLVHNRRLMHGDVRGGFLADVSGLPGIALRS
jgi:hypothetical protein